MSYSIYVYILRTMYSRQINDSCILLFPTYTGTKYALGDCKRDLIYIL